VTAFFNISIWITLAMVVPGMVSMATLFGAMAVSNVWSILPVASTVKEFSDWAVAGIAVTIMIMTQAVGILLESFLIKGQWLGPEKNIVVIPQGVDPLGEEEFELEPYAEYQGLYLLLAELRGDEDSHGHLQRVLAQFFLSNNALVSFAPGDYRDPLVHNRGARPCSPCPRCVPVSPVGMSRHHRQGGQDTFEVMTKALWAARRRRLVDARQQVQQRHDG